MLQRTAVSEIGKVQRLACLGITGAIKSTPTAAMEALLDLPPLHLVILGEGRMGYFRLQDKPRGTMANLGHNKIGEQVEVSIADMTTDHMVPKYIFNQNFQVSIRSREERQTESTSTLNGITWYTDGSKTEQGAGAGVYSDVLNVEDSTPLGKYTSVFQTEVYAILQCVRENIRRAYVNKRIYILTDSQAALKGLMNHKVMSRLVWECHKELECLARHNRVVLMWVPGHTGIEGNEKADELAREGSSAPYTGPEPALGVSKTSVRGEIRNWVRKKHDNYWENITRHQHGKTFIGKPSKKLAEEVLKLSRNQLRTVTGLLTGHCALKGHLRRMGLYDADPACRLCGREVESAFHILCECEALDHRRQTIYGWPRLSPEEYKSQPVSGLYKLIQGTALLDWVL